MSDRSGGAVDWSAWSEAREAGRSPEEAAEAARRGREAGDLAWTDPVRGTRWVLASSRLDRVVAEGLGALRVLPSHGWGLEDLRALLRGDPEPRPWPDAEAARAVRRLLALPAADRAVLARGASADVRPARLVDAVALTLAVLWCVGGGPVRAEFLPVGAAVALETLAWHAADGVRRQLLDAWGVSDPGDRAGIGGPVELARRVGRAAAGGPPSDEEAAWLGQRADAPGIALFKAHTVRIKSYYLQSNHLPAIRGASRLLDEVGRRRFAAAFRPEQGLVPECLVYAGGAGVLAVVPPERAAHLVACWETLHARGTVLARGVAAWLPCTPRDLAVPERFRRLHAVLEARLEARRGACWPVVLDPVREDVDLEDAGWTWSDLEEVAEPDRVCAHCGLYRARYHLPNPERHAVCVPCAVKWQTGRREAPAAFHDRYRAFRRARGLPEPAAPPRRAMSLEELVRPGRQLAVAYADGNDMGRVLQGIETPGQLRLFSEELADAVERAVFAAVDRRLGGPERVEFLALAGDDVFLLLPADAALPFAADVVRGFEEAFWDPSAGRPVLTLSLGLALGRVDTPVAILFERAREALHRAKTLVRRRARRQADAGARHGTLGWEAVEGLLVGVRAAVGAGPGGARLEPLGPVDWRGAEALASLIQVVRSRGGAVLSRSFLYALAATLRPGDPASAHEAELLLAYRLARHATGSRRAASSEVCEAVRALRAATGGTGDGLAAWPVPGPDEQEPRLRTPWWDVLDLWNAAAPTALVATEGATASR